MENNIGFKDEFLNSLSKLSKEQKDIFDRIYKVWVTKGRLEAPKEMKTWIESTFGSVEDVEYQEFVKIMNTVLYEGTIFNELRTKRPMVFDNTLDEVIKEIEAGSNGPFAHPLTGTPADTFGRVKGKYCITASNISKYDGLHGLVIFDDHNPLKFSSERIRDYFDVAKKWFKKGHETKERAVYPFLTWNCLWNAGASIVHGHMQLALTEGHAYAKVEELRNLSHKYQETHRANYFDDNYDIHKNLGLAYEKDGVKVIAKITPIKEKELMIYNHGLNDGLADALNDVLTVMKEDLGVYSFNISITLPPMEKTPEVWDHMPVLVRFVDRGNLTAKTADIGSMELYAQSVVGSNPYNVIKALQKSK